MLFTELVAKSACVSSLSKLHCLFGVLHGLSLEDLAQTFN